MQVDSPAVEHGCLYHTTKEGCWVSYRRAYSWLSKRDGIPKLLWRARNVRVETWSKSFWGWGIRIRPGGVPRRFSRKSASRPPFRSGLFRLRYYSLKLYYALPVSRWFICKSEDKMGSTTSHFVIGRVSRVVIAPVNPRFTKSHPLCKLWMLIAPAWRNRAMRVHEPPWGAWCMVCGISFA